MLQVLGNKANVLSLQMDPPIVSERLYDYLALRRDRFEKSHHLEIYFLIEVKWERNQLEIDLMDTSWESNHPEIYFLKDVYLSVECLHIVIFLFPCNLSRTEYSHRVS